MSIRTDLEAAWADWLRDTNDANKRTQAWAWRRDNQAEWNKIVAYRNGGPRPHDIMSIPGLEHLKLTDAWLLTAPVGPPPPPPPPPPPTPDPDPIPGPGAYLYERWDSGSVPSPWNASTFFNYQGANASAGVIEDPLGQRGKVLRLRCPYTPLTMPVNSNYPSSILQQAAVNVTPQYARAARGNDTWYRADFMFPVGNVFCNGFSNFLIEWHTQATGPTSTGLFAYGGYPLTSGGTTTPRLVMVVRSGNVGAPTQTFFPPAAGAGAVETSQGLPILNGRWYKSVWHFKWSPDPTIGLFEWWLDDVLIVSKKMATHFTQPEEILSYACYNYRYHVAGDSNIYYDTKAIGPTRESIAA